MQKRHPSSLLYDPSDDDASTLAATVVDDAPTIATADDVSSTASSVEFAKRGRAYSEVVDATEQQERRVRQRQERETSATLPDVEEEPTTETATAGVCEMYSPPDTPVDPPSPDDEGLVFPPLILRLDTPVDSERDDDDEGIDERTTVVPVVMAPVPAVAALSPRSPPFFDEAFDSRTRWRRREPQPLQWRSPPHFSSSDEDEAATANGERTGHAGGGQTADDAAQ
jgi:hypothetical protein